MPTPILRVPIDDEAFKSFLKTFEKYRTQLKEQEGDWGDVNDAVVATVASNAALANEMERQVSALKDANIQEEERDRRADKMERRHRQNAKDRDKREEEVQQRRKRSIQFIKEQAQVVSGAARSFASWGLLDSILGIGTAVLSGFGLTQLAQGVGDERRLSSGLGVGMGARQGLAANVGRYFDVNQVLENIANAQADPGKWATFATMGVNRNQNPAQLAEQMALQARKMFLADKGNLALAQSQGLLNIFTPDDLRRMAGTPEAEMRMQFSRSRKVQGLSDEVARKWQDFTSQISMTGLALQNKFMDKISRLEPSLEKLIGKFGDLAVALLDRIDWETLGQGLDSFTKYITSPEFIDSLKEFGSDMSYLVQQLKGWMKFFALLPDGKSNTVDVDPTLVIGSDPLSRGMNWLLNRDLDILNGRYFAPSQSKASQADKDYVAQKLMSGGWDKNQTAGLMANIDAESGYDPFAKGDWNAFTRSYDAYGIGQWHADRQAKYTSIFKHTMQSVTDRRQALKEQLEFMNWELHNTESRAGNALRQARSAYEAGSTVSRLYERPRDADAQARRRGSIAAQVNITVSNQTGSSVATTTNTAKGG